MRLRQPEGPERPAGRTESDRLLDAAPAGRAATVPGPAAAAREADAAAGRDFVGPGRPDGASAADPLVRLLTAAAGPARPGELAGEEAALAAFRAARAVPARASARAPRRRRLTVGAVAWIGALAVTATAGVAFAAATLDRKEGPAPVTAPTHPAPTRPAPTGSGPTGPGPTSSGIATPSGDAATTGEASPNAPSGPATPTPTGPGRSGGGAQLPGLCRAYLTKPAAQRERALTRPGFAPLVAAAGGVAQVKNFCRALVSETGPDRTPTPRPSRPLPPDADKTAGENPDAVGATPAA
ncbi:hypothetical protein [Micromonospora sp. RTGN7]|uniref:hypothetical protein n=1 Tax=Micromonospora sp. RTGN7 TaxID=3016526 RepID=UPI0029FF1C07|nr:hypothetical protein [Micromonospora sp. RTGN7]